MIAGILYLFAGHWAGISAPNLYPDSARMFISGLIGVNVILAIFNLIPAFPMDGGRVLRGILALKMDYIKATSTAVFIGQAIAMLFVFYGVFFNWWLALIGFFLYMGAGGEKQQVMMRSVLHRVSIRQVMATDIQALRPDGPLSKALEHVYQGCRDDFPVIGDKGIVGILTRTGVLSAIHEKGVELPVSEAMDRNFISVDLRMPLDEVYQQLLSNHKTAAAVVDRGQLKGMVCLESISRYFMIQNALREKGLGLTTAKTATR